MKYIDENHTYISDSGDNYISTTRLIKQYEQWKDWNEIARRYAEKNKKTVEEVQAAWREEGRKAIDKGIAYHNKMEADLIEQMNIEVEGRSYQVFPTPLQDGIKIALGLKLDEGVYPELIVYSHKYKVAGQADVVEIVNGKINIIDYKTSKEIKMESYKHWRHGHEMLKFPVSHLMNCNFNTYSLQLNIYMFLLKGHNPKLKVGKMEIHHVKDDELEIYKVSNLQKEAKALLTDYAGKNL